MRTDSDPVEICLPIFSDETVVQIYDLLNDFLCVFESHYGDQIRRYSQDQSSDNFVNFTSRTDPAEDDPPF